MSFIDSDIVEIMCKPISYDSICEVISNSYAINDPSHFYLPQQQQQAISKEMHSSLLRHLSQSVKQYALQSFTYEIWERIDLKLDYSMEENFVLSRKIEQWRNLIIHKLNQLNQHIFMFIVTTVCRDYFLHHVDYVTNTPIVRGCGLRLTCQLSAMKKEDEKQSEKISVEIRNALTVMLQDIVQSYSQQWVFLHQLFSFNLFQVVFIPWTVKFNQQLNTSVDQSELSALKDYFANKDVQ